MEEKEIWVPITKPVDLAGHYKISNRGRVKRCSWRNKTDGRRHSEKLISGWVSDGKYVKIELGLAGGGKKYSLARLVGFHFVPNPNNYPEIDHKDFNKLNNAASNLEWVTGQENMDRYYSSDRVVRGERPYKYSVDDVIFIRKNFWLLGKEKLAERFKTSPAVIYAIATGRQREDVEFAPYHRFVGAKRIIIDINAGVFYESPKELADLLGMKVKELRRRLNGERQNNTRYRYC